MLRRARDSERQVQLRCTLAPDFPTCRTLGSQPESMTGRDAPNSASSAVARSSAMGMFSAPPMPRPTQTIRSAFVRSTPSSGGTTGSTNVVLRLSSSAGGGSWMRSPRPADSRLFVQGHGVDRKHRRQRRAHGGLELPPVDPARRLRLSILQRQPDAVATNGRPAAAAARGPEVEAGRGVLEHDQVGRALADRGREHRLVRFREVGRERRGAIPRAPRLPRSSPSPPVGSPLATKGHEVAACRVCQRAGESQQAVVDRRLNVDKHVAHQPARTPRSRSTSTICAAAFSASPSSIVA